MKKSIKEVGYDPAPLKRRFFNSATLIKIKGLELRNLDILTNLNDMDPYPLFQNALKTELFNLNVKVISYDDLIESKSKGKNMEINYEIKDVNDIMKMDLGGVGSDIIDIEYFKRRKEGQERQKRKEKENNSRPC